MDVERRGRIEVAMSKTVHFWERNWKQDYRINSSITFSNEERRSFVDDFYSLDFNEYTKFISTQAFFEDATTTWKTKQTQMLSMIIYHTLKGADVVVYNDDQSDFSTADTIVEKNGFREQSIFFNSVELQKSFPEDHEQKFGMIIENLFNYGFKPYVRENGKKLRSLSNEFFFAESDEEKMSILKEMSSIEYQLLKASFVGGYNSPPELGSLELLSSSRKLIKGDGMPIGVNPSKNISVTINGNAGQIQIGDNGTINIVENDPELINQIIVTLQNHKELLSEINELKTGEAPSDEKKMSVFTRIVRKAPEILAEKLIKLGIEKVIPLIFYAYSAVEKML